MGSFLNRTAHSSSLVCVRCKRRPSQATVCLSSLKAPSFLIIGNRTRGFDACEQGWPSVQRRARRSPGQGKEGKEREDKKESFSVSNRAFPVGKKASFNSACPTGVCNDKVSSISRVFSVPGRSGILSNPAGTRLASARLSSASGLMDTGTLESDPVGNVLPELVKDAFADPAMLRVRDRAAAHDVRALDDLDEGKKGLPEVFDSRLSMHRVLCLYKHKIWKTHQNTVCWVDIKLAQKKGLKFYQTRSNAIILDDTLPAYCIHKAIMMGFGETIYEKVFASPRPPPKISFKDN